MLPGDPATEKTSGLVTADFLVDLMTALSTIAPPLAGRAANQLLANPETYGFDAVLIPAVLKLIPGPPLPAVVRLRTACLAHLRARIAEPLEAPRDWRRESRLPCSCEDCRDLARFLADPERRSWVFKAAQGRRCHVERSSTPGVTPTAPPNAKAVPTT